ncbi:MAG TPA: SLBB domain-containing protein [Abditibacterium sp.]|jgi:hypothetical protein
MKPFTLALAFALSATPLVIAPSEAQPVAPLQKAKTVTVFISGEVLHPGTYTLKVADKETVIDLIAAAGGVTQRAAVDEVFWRHGAAKFIVNVPELIASGKKADSLLSDGDHVNVPLQINSVFVMGMVKAPGHYTFPQVADFRLQKPWLWRAAQQEASRSRESCARLLKRVKPRHLGVSKTCP